MNAGLADGHNLGQSSSLAGLIGQVIEYALSLEDHSSTQELGRHVVITDRTFIQEIILHILTRDPQYELERRQFAQELIKFDKEWAAIVSGKASAENYLSIQM